ncbi:hypothetical protein O4160_15170 [Rhodococcus sp. IEGM 1401]|uniref:hypothetical protein n=1 Tax=Nocardiaceae TaxID=85025 RepID=UPI000B9AE2C7|nr:MULTISPECIES: hypothetical protein [Rhodococcus]OZD36504.1 hypothetical protein CH252_34060 [Rhodococcus sp. 06-1477-1B]MBW4781983.1 hypothetical protein [Rhodococcus fascians]MBY4213327.1 hypothetical protein [Rhodococcus fascians]MBY4238391.1 hypothetical protein [Rhodococcus fascians]MBY4254228.1 hypothetical protein [Rhodococcus fascians]
MNRTATIVLACFGIVGAVTIAAAIVFFSRGSDTPPRAGTDAGIAIDPSATDPAGVATSVMSGVYTWQPAVQDSPWEALHEQRDNLTGPMATAAAARPIPAPQPMSEWSAWSRSSDIVTAITTLDGEPSIGTGKATVPVVISQTVQHTSGEITPYTAYTATVDLERTDHGWKVANYRLDNASR